MQPTPFGASIRRYGVIGLVLGAVHALLVSVVYQIVPNTYMDEIFHVDQTRRYCHGNYTWNPMITTPPGLYFLTKVIHMCGRERYINSLLTPFLYVAACRFRSMFTRQSVGFTSLIFITLPVMLHSSLLFYTDHLSMFLVLLAFPLQTLPAALVFGASMLVRQTNIAWAFLYAGTSFFNRLDPKRPLDSSLRSLVRLLPFILLAVAFAAFIVWNGGAIVLGDASAHQPVVHIPQLLYFSLFASAHTWPHLLSSAPAVLLRLLRPSSVILLLLSALSIHHFTLAHPYLLADNRHIPFYFYRRVLSGGGRWLLLPVYLGCVSWLALSSAHLSRVSRGLFVVATAVTLVPAHLIEFRYFIIPFALWRLSFVQARSSQIPAASIFELFSNISVFSFLFLLFLFKPFEWSNEPGALQRFMW